MKKSLLCFLVAISLATMAYSQATLSDSVYSYLSKTKPDATPLKFNFSISSGFFAAERVAISPNGKEIYYTELNGYGVSSKARIKYYRYSNGKWNGPVTLFEQCSSPSLSPDGTTMYFQHFSHPWEIWYSERADSVWSAPARYLPNVPMQYLLQQTNKGNYYFATTLANGNVGGRDWAKMVIIGTDTTLQSMGIPVNKAGDDLDYYMSGDESYIILASGPIPGRPSNGILDLFVSYSKADGTWTNPKNLGTKINVVNSNDGRWAPCLTTDNKYLFYTGGWNSPAVYWVRIDELIENLRHTNFAPYINKTISDTSATVGKQFTFTIPENTFIDEDGNPTLTFDAKLPNGDPLPAWLTFKSSTRTFSGIPTTTEKFNVKVFAFDTANANVYDVFILDVKAPKVGIENSAFNSEMMVYPNPNNGKFAINFGTNPPKEVELELYTMEGKQVVKRTFRNTTTGTIDLTGEPKGIYVAKLWIDGVLHNRKVCIE